MRSAKGEGTIFFVASRAQYRGYVTVDGKRKYFSGKTKAEASQARKELIRRRDSGEVVHGREYTVGEWLDHWLNNVLDVKPYTLQTYRWTTEKVIKPKLGHVKLLNLRPEHIEEWMSGLTQSPATVRRFHSILRAALNVAVSRGHLPRNPTLLARAPRAPKPKTDSFSLADALAILAAVEGRRNAVRWHLGIREGLRPGEITGLTWPDFDMKTGTLTVHRQLTRVTGRGLVLQESPKTRAGERVIRLAPSLATMMREHRTHQLLEMAELGEDWRGWEFGGVPVPLIFTTATGSAIDAANDRREWNRILDAAGLPRANRYRARHTAATLMLLEGADVAVVAKKLGHADPAFTYRTYVHPLDVREDELGERMDERFSADAER